MSTNAAHQVEGVVWAASQALAEENETLRARLGLAKLGAA